MFEWLTNFDKEVHYLQVILVVHVANWVVVCDLINQENALF